MFSNSLWDTCSKNTDRFSRTEGRQESAKGGTKKNERKKLGKWLVLYVSGVNVPDGKMEILGRRQGREMEQKEQREEIERAS